MDIALRSRVENIAFALITSHPDADADKPTTQAVSLASVFSFTAALDTVRDLIALPEFASVDSRTTAESLFSAAGATSAMSIVPAESLVSCLMSHLSRHATPGLDNSVVISRQRIQVQVWEAAIRLIRSHRAFHVIQDCWSETVHNTDMGMQRRREFLSGGLSLSLGSDGSSAVSFAVTGLAVGAAKFQEIEEHTSDSVIIRNCIVAESGHTFALTHKIREALYGVVWAASVLEADEHGLFRANGQQVAIKSLEKRLIEQRIGKDGEHMQECSLSELVTLQFIHALTAGRGHPHIIRLLGTLATESNFLAVEELAGGELFDIIMATPEGYFTELVTRGLFSQILSGVSFCHQRGIAHLDLSLENLLISRDNHIRINPLGLGVDSIDTFADLDGTFCRIWNNSPNSPNEKYENSESDPIQQDDVSKKTIYKKGKDENSTSKSSLHSDKIPDGGLSPRTISRMKNSSISPLKTDKKFPLTCSTERISTNSNGVHNYNNNNNRKSNLRINSTPKEHADTFTFGSNSVTKNSSICGRAILLPAIRIIDFGLSRRIPIGNNGERQLFPARSMFPTNKSFYLDPDICALQAFDGEKADIWSCGAILWIMLFGSPCFERSHIFDPNYARICESLTENSLPGDTGLRGMISEQATLHGKPISQECEDLLCLLLDPRAECRPTAKAVSEHPWLRGFQERMILKPGVASPRAAAAAAAAANNSPEKNTGIHVDIDDFMDRSVTPLPFTPPWTPPIIASSVVCNSPQHVRSKLPLQAYPCRTPPLPYICNNKKETSNEIVDEVIQDTASNEIVDEVIQDTAGDDNMDRSETPAVVNIEVNETNKNYQNRPPMHPRRPLAPVPKRSGEALIASRLLSRGKSRRRPRSASWDVPVSHAAAVAQGQGWDNRLSSEDDDLVDVSDSSSDEEKELRQNFRV